jgi:rhamnogalacturonan endolyase
MNKLRLFFMSLMALITIASKAQVTPACQMEKLDRGLVAVPTSTTANFVSWRLLGTDDKANTTFDLLRNGTVIASGLTKTNYQDTQGSATAKYQVVTKVNGSAIENSAEVTPWGKKYLSLKLDRPKGGTDSKWTNTDNTVGSTSATYAYYPNDMSVGDVDGDGQYELFLKWESTHAQDNSRSLGATGNTFIDCYKLDGTRLWRLDLGLNIRDGAHYTQFMVYDFDGDGKAEMM